MLTRTPSAPSGGDPRLIERLDANLLDNAVDYNIPEGRVEVVTGTKAGRAFLSVANTGPVIRPEQIDRLFEPFQRLGTDRTRHTNDHHGIGLSIVRAIAEAHDATLTARPQSRGGLQIEITFPPNGNEQLQPNVGRLIQP